MPSMLPGKGSLVEERGLQMRRALEKKEAQQALEGLVSVSRTDNQSAEPPGREGGLGRGTSADDGQAQPEVEAELTFDDSPCAENRDQGTVHKKMSPQSLESIIFGQIESPRVSLDMRHSADWNCINASFDESRMGRELIDRENVLQLLVGENRSLHLYIDTLKQTILDLGGAVPGPSPEASLPVNETTMHASLEFRDAKTLDAVQTEEHEIGTPSAASNGSAGAKIQKQVPHGPSVECCRCRSPLVRLRHEKQMARSRSWPSSPSLPRSVPLHGECSASFRAEMASVQQSFAQRSSTSADGSGRAVAASPGHTIFNQNAVSFFDSIVSGLTLGVSTPSKRSGQVEQETSQQALVKGLNRKITSLQYNNDQLLLFVLDARERYPDLYLPDLG